MNNTNKPQRMRRIPAFDLFRDPVDTLNEVVSALENRFSEMGLLKDGGRDYPRVNLSEDDTHYYVEAAVPGWRREDIKVAIEDDFLVLTGTQSETREVKDTERKYLERRIASRNFSRLFKLPQNIATHGSISADLKGGILSIVLPKIEQNEPESIDIEIK